MATREEVGEIRAASKKILDQVKQLAEQGTDTPTWFHERKTDPELYPWAVSARPLNDMGNPFGMHIGTGVTPQVAEYMALMHPGVARAVGGWLGCVALDDEWEPESAARAREFCAALAVARAINGEVQP